MIRIDSEKLSTKCRIHCCSIVRTSILYMHASQNDDATNFEPRKATAMSNATAKRISSGEYEYRGFRIARGWDGDWIIYRQCQGWEGNTILDAVDQLDTLGACKRMIDRWENN